MKTVYQPGTNNYADGLSRQSLSEDMVEDIKSSVGGGY